MLAMVSRLSIWPGLCSCVYFVILNLQVGFKTLQYPHQPLPLVSTFLSKIHFS